MIDLRSDTVTRPSAPMRAAMASAEVGDDVLDGDPTTRRLEERVAALLGHEDALFFPSGTMANQAGIWLDTRPGTELIVEAGAHLVHYEIAGVASLSGVQVRTVPTPDGVLTAELIRPMLRAESPHVPRLSAIAVENTHNGSGGRVMPVEVMRGIAALAKELRLPLHLDGARLWNVAIALGVPPAAIASQATTAMVAFSKALGCPVGSALGFPKAARRDVWEIRKRLGGGMRQSGILAAAALYALDHHYERIAEDHANAKRLAAALDGHPAVKPVPPDSNIVMLDLVRPGDTTAVIVPKLAEQGVKAVAWSPTRIRTIVHMDVSRADIDRAIDVISSTLQ